MSAPTVKYVPCSFCPYPSAGVIWSRGRPAQRAWCAQCWRDGLGRAAA